MNTNKIAKLKTAGKIIGVATFIYGATAAGDAMYRQGIKDGMQDKVNQTMGSNTLIIDGDGHGQKSPPQGINIFIPYNNGIGKGIKLAVSVTTDADPLPAGGTGGEQQGEVQDTETSVDIEASINKQIEVQDTETSMDIESSG